MVKLIIPYLFLSILSLVIQLSRVGIPLTSLTLPHCCAFPKPGPGLPKPYVVVFFVIDGFKWMVMIRFVDIDGIV